MIVNIDQVSVASQVPIPAAASANLPPVANNSFKRLFSPVAFMLFLCAVKDWLEMMYIPRKDQILEASAQ